MLSLRDSGKIAERSVSIRQAALDCNLPFPLSLRKFISTRGCPFSRCIHLHVKVLTEPNGHTIRTMLNRMREVYGTVRISVVLASWEDLTPDTLGNANFTNLNDLDVGECRRGTASNEQNQLFQNQNNVPAGQRNNEILVYFVRSVTTANGGNLNGCASFPSDQPGAVVAQIASQWTLAHEVGHVLGLDHILGEHQDCPANNPECCNTPDFTRLMTGCSTSNITDTPTFDQDEVDRMTSSNLIRQC